MSKVFVVVVNYHSWDRIKRLKVPNLIVIDNDKSNLGFAAGVNQGIKRALKSSATHILLVNPDVVITESDIQKLLETDGDVVSPVLKFQRQGKWIYDFGGKVNWVFGRTVHIETASDQRPASTAKRGEPATSDQLDYVSGACMLIRREVFEKIGFFDERFFLYFEDVDFCLRAKRAGFKVLVNPKVLVQHDIDEQRHSHDRFKIQQNLKSNLLFIHKWIPWYFQPVAHIYLLLLTAKIIFNVGTTA